MVEVKKSELDQVDDLFSPKEFGRLLGEVYLNGWDTEKAKDIVEEFHDEYKDVFVKNKVTFRGAHVGTSHLVRLY